MYPFERFTERAKMALRLAQEEAEGSHESYIGTQHLLLGLLREGEGLAAKVLNNLGIEIGKVRQSIGVFGGDVQIIIQQIIPTSRVKKVIEISFEEARLMGHNYVGTEHLLLGLLIEKEGSAARVLRDMGASLEKVRGEIERLLHDSSATSEVPIEPVPYMVGQRVLVHDADPPHRLWEGRITMAEGQSYQVSIPRHESGESVSADERLIHPIPMTWTRACPFCKEG